MPQARPWGGEGANSPDQGVGADLDSCSSMGATVTNKVSELVSK